MRMLGNFDESSSYESLDGPSNNSDTTLTHTDDESFTIDDEADEELAILETKWLQESQVWFSTLPWYFHPSKNLLYAILALHTLSFTILMGPLMVLLLENICGGLDFTECSTGSGQRTLSNIQTVLSLISGLLGFAVSGVFGQWSDTSGRVFVFKLFSGINVGYIVGLFVYFKWYAEFNQLFMVLMLSLGFINGGVMTLIANGNSYLNDLVTAEERTTAISRLMAVIYTMLGVGPLLGSLVIKWTGGDSSVVLNWSLVFGLGSMALIFGFMTETRHARAMERAKQLYAEASQVRSGSTHEKLRDNLKSFIHPIKRVWLPPSTTGSLVPRRNLVCLVLIDVLVMCSTVGTLHTVIMYTMSEYQWSSVEIGYYMSLTGFGKSLVLLAVAPGVLWMIKDKTHWNTVENGVDKIDKTMITGSSVLIVLSCITITMWRSATGVYASAVLQSLAGLMSPTVQSAVIKYSSKTTAGEMFGTIALLRHLAMLVAPVFFLQLYKFTLNVWPSCFLFVALLCGGMSFVLAQWGLRAEELTMTAE